MKIVLASPLYPPDIAAPAPYVKELAKRLAGAHEVTVVTYGRLPEQVEGANIVAVDKRRSLPVRLFLYTLALMRAARGADVIYFQNGPSVELPAGIVVRLSRAKSFAHTGDTAAHEYANRHAARGMIERFACAKARMIEAVPPQKPEILPFALRPGEALRAWEESWTRHIAELEEQFNA